MDKKLYQEYLQSAHWQSVRAIKLYEQKYKCENCGSEKRLQVHHNHYKSLYHEINSDLKVLCEFCHTEIEHGGKAKGYNSLVAFLGEEKRFKTK